MSRFMAFVIILLTDEYKVTATQASESDRF